ncbi:hypothetical protein Pelo_3406 [Pelomyxa schiedti]|nr:hypothetical protein Pelo_3406 [Pelomyxa schiedti]
MHCSFDSSVHMDCVASPPFGHMLALFPSGIKLFLTKKLDSVTDMSQRVDLLLNDSAESISEIAFSFPGFISLSWQHPAEFNLAFAGCSESFQKTWNFDWELGSVLCSLFFYESHGEIVSYTNSPDWLFHCCTP